MSANPYDRRRGDRPRHDAMTAGEWLPLGPRPSSPLSVPMLEAMVAAARHEGAESGRETQYQAVLEARRVAWDEGYSEGVSAGCAELLERIDQRVGKLARDRHQAGRELLARVGERPRDVTKVELERELDAAIDTLATLVTEHHNGFVQQVPF